MRTRLILSIVAISILCAGFFVRTAICPEEEQWYLVFEDSQEVDTWEQGEGLTVIDSAELRVLLMPSTCYSNDCSPAMLTVYNKSNKPISLLDIELITPPSYELPTEVYRLNYSRSCSANRCIRSEETSDDDFQVEVDNFRKIKSKLRQLLPEENAYMNFFVQDSEDSSVGYLEGSAEVKIKYKSDKGEQSLSRKFSMQTRLARLECTERIMLWFLYLIFGGK